MTELTDYAWTEHELLEYKLSIISWHAIRLSVEIFSGKYIAEGKLVKNINYRSFPNGYFKLIL
jgi:hypothetical protein